MKTTVQDLMNVLRAMFDEMVSEGMSKEDFQEAISQLELN